MVNSDTYLSIASFSEGIYKEKGSKFIGLAFPVVSEDEIKTRLKEMKKEHHQANHHCYAFRLGFDGILSRSSDDREPSGSAGRPILNQLQSSALSDILIIVARYFGGSLLGVPGLINAYRTAAKEAIVNATITEKIMMDDFCVSFQFQSLNEIMKLLRTNKSIIRKQDLSDHCTIEFRIRKSLSAQLVDHLKKIHHAVKITPQEN